ncbi:hypothetical protein [Gemmatimonas sp.]
MAPDFKEHFHRRGVVECALSGGRHERRVMRDAAGTIEFEYCARCGDRRYRVPDDGTMTAWDRDKHWRLRFQARRVFDAIVAAAQATHPKGPESGRREMIAIVAQWLGTAEVGSWYAWSLDTCERIVRHGHPVLAEYADLLVTGESRHLLHVARSRTTRFPRLTYVGLCVRDAVTTRVERWLAQWRG